MKHSRIILTGFMGTGKTAVAKGLAEKLDYDFLDTDEMVEVETGKSITQIFEAEGEAGFRTYEKRMLKRALERDQIVIATGGGAVIDADNRKLMKEKSFVIALSASPEMILERVSSVNQRPLLDEKDKDRLKRIKEMISHRSPFYAQANRIIDTTVHSVPEIVESISKILHDNH